MDRSHLEPHQFGELLKFIDWLIIGGESGPGARDFHLYWPELVIEQCRKYGTAPFVKQIGSRPYQQQSPDHLRTYYPIHDKKGGDMSEWPAAIRVREYPQRRVS